MSGRHWPQCLFAALVAASFLVLPVAPSAQAQTRGAHGVNTSFNKAIGNPGIGRGHRSHRLFRNRHSRSIFDRRLFRSIFDRRFNEGGSRQERRDSRKFHEDRERSKFDKRFDHGFRHRYFPTYGSGYRRYDEDENFEYQEDPSGGPEDGSGTASEIQPQPSVPVTPKWIRVEVQVPVESAATVGDSYAQSGLDGSCRDGKIEITVDGKPIEAFREDCPPGKLTIPLSPGSLAPCLEAPSPPCASSAYRSETQVS